MKKQNKKGRVISLLTKKEIPQQEIIEKDNARVDFLADVVSLIIDVRTIVTIKSYPESEKLVAKLDNMFPELLHIEDEYIHNSTQAVWEKYIAKDDRCSKRKGLRHVN